jgi:hypothetical protein
LKSEEEEGFLMENRNLREIFFLSGKEYDKVNKIDGQRV